MEIECANCSNAANPGKTLCGSCLELYLSSRQARLCKLCNNPSEDGRSLCTSCFQHLCPKCHRSLATPGHTWCSNCYNKSKANYTNYTEEPTVLCTSIFRASKHCQLLRARTKLTAGTNEVRLIFISDTHAHESLYTKEILLKAQEKQPCILFHCGDWTIRGNLNHHVNFMNWLGQLPGFKHKFVVSGNHEIVCNQRELNHDVLRQHCSTLENVHYLVNDTAVLQEFGNLTVRGLSFWGFRDSAHKARYIPYKSPDPEPPAKCHVLVAHQPARGILDGQDRGSKGNLKMLREADPVVFVFGHAHVKPVDHQVVQPEGGSWCVNTSLRVSFIDFTY